MQRRPQDDLSPSEKSGTEGVVASRVRRAPRWVAGVLCMCIAGAVLTQSRVARSSVEEQRRRLPPPARDCEDPIAGVWMGHQLLNGYWYRFTLDIHREEPGEKELEGKIESHYWNNLDSSYEPPPCDGRHQQTIIDMPAEGKYEDNVITFIGQSWSLRQEVCGRFSGAYYPDGFSGALIEDGTEFVTENDDGHNPVTKVVFRRIRCNDAEKPTPKLPDLEEPPQYSSGCGGCF